VAAGNIRGYLTPSGRLLFRKRDALMAAEAARGQDTNDMRSAEVLLAELRNSRTDMWRWVKAASESQSPRVVIPAGTIRAWQQREPEIWAKVAGWFAAHGKRIVES
jgi:hypothetical protein